MSYKINKITLNYQKYNKLLSFSKNKNNLNINGFFGSVSLKIPANILLELDKKDIKLYFDSNKFIYNSRLLKSFYHNIIFSVYGQVFNHFVNISIKGIGYKFKLEKNKIIVYSGNSLPTLFEIPDNLKVLDNLNSNNFSIIGSDYTFLNNFINKIRNISKPNKYKEIGIFLEKRL